MPITLRLRLGCPLHRSTARGRDLWYVSFPLNVLSCSPFALRPNVLRDHLYFWVKFGAVLALRPDGKWRKRECDHNCPPFIVPSSPCTARLQPLFVSRSCSSANYSGSNIVGIDRHAGHEPGGTKRFYSWWQLRRHHIHLLPPSLLIGHSDHEANVMGRTQSV